MSAEANDTLIGARVDVSNPGSRLKSLGGPMFCVYHWGEDEGDEGHGEGHGRVCAQKDV